MGAGFQTKRPAKPAHTAGCARRRSVARLRPEIGSHEGVGEYKRKESSGETHRRVEYVGHGWSDYHPNRRLGGVSAAIARQTWRTHR